MMLKLMRKISSLSEKLVSFTFIGDTGILLRNLEIQEIYNRQNMQIGFLGILSYIF